MPPEKVTRSNPIFVYFPRFSTGGTSAERAVTWHTAMMLFYNSWSAVCSAPVPSSAERRSGRPWLTLAPVWRGLHAVIRPLAAASMKARTVMHGGCPDPDRQC